MAKQRNFGRLCPGLLASALVALASEPSQCHPCCHACSERLAQRIDVFPAAATQLQVADPMVYHSSPPLPNVSGSLPSSVWTSDAIVALQNSRMVLKTTEDHSAISWMPQKNSP